MAIRAAVCDAPNAPTRAALRVPQAGVDVRRAETKASAVENHRGGEHRRRESQDDAPACPLRAQERAEPRAHVLAPREILVSTAEHCANSDAHRPVAGTRPSVRAPGTPAPSSTPSPTIAAARRAARKSASAQTGSARAQPDSSAVVRYSIATENAAAAAKAVRGAFAGILPPR